ncbi:MAG: hypothetical protein WBO36_11550 [Saprospiraceae bacterium]
MEIRKAKTDQDILGVLQLQDRYLYSHLSATERMMGFVTTPFDETQISSAIGEGGLYIATIDGKIIGYLFAGTWSYFDQWPMFSHMVTLLDKYTFEGQILSKDLTFQYGPVCLDIKFRHQGVFQLLFEYMRNEWAKYYPISITFINQINTHSWFAHINKLGWVGIDTFQYNGNVYHLLAYDMTKPVKS